jgi:hypothetical protein
VMLLVACRPRRRRRDTSGHAVSTPETVGITG